MGSTPPAAFAPRPDDDDDVRWALSTALVQWNRGGRADAVVWLRRAGEAADASGAPARAIELRQHAAALAETFWSQPPSAADDLDVEIEVEGDRKAPLPPPPAAVRAAQARAPSLPPLAPLSTHPDERQSIAELAPRRQHLASAPEIVFEEEGLDASELEEILDYVGDDELELVEPVSSARRGGPPSFDDRLSSASTPPLTVEAVLPVRASDPELLAGEEAELIVERVSETDVFALRQSGNPAPSERLARVALPPDDDGEDFDDRVTMVPHSADAEAVRVASARSAPPGVGSLRGGRDFPTQTRHAEPTELFDGEEALAIDGDLHDSYRPQSIDLGADWAPIESEPGPPGGESQGGSSSFDAAEAFGSVVADSDAADIVDRKTRDGVLADEFETQFGSSKPPRPDEASLLELVPLSSAEAEFSDVGLEAELVPLSSLDAELVPESEIATLSDADLIPMSVGPVTSPGLGARADEVGLESIPPLEFASEPPPRSAGEHSSHDLAELVTPLIPGDVEAALLAAGSVDDALGVEETSLDTSLEFVELDEETALAIEAAARADAGEPRSVRSPPTFAAAPSGFPAAPSARVPAELADADEGAVPAEIASFDEVAVSVVDDAALVSVVEVEEVPFGVASDVVLLDDLAVLSVVEDSHAPVAGELAVGDGEMSDEAAEAITGAPPAPAPTDPPPAPAPTDAPSGVQARSVAESVVEDEGSGPATLESASLPPQLSPNPYVVGTTIDGVDLMTTRGFEDLPEEVQLQLAHSSRVETLAAGEEVGLFGAAIITHGQVNVLPAFADEAGAVASQADVIFTRGSLEDSIALRVVAKVDGTRVAVWDPQPLADAIDACPWVHDELRMIADRFLALCGATLGPLGERLDESLRSAVFQRLEVRTFGPGEELTTEGKALPGLFVIGGGRVDIVKGGEVREQKSPGDFLFAMAIMGGSKSPATARAGEQGALALFASRAVAHELMISVPPLLEVLAG
jgi:CRP-like cAMP-binding protein